MAKYILEKIFEDLNLTERKDVGLAVGENR
jgi:hypothetical protein